MKIFLIASECPPVAGGIATYVGNTADMFADTENEITIFARSHQPEVEQRGNIKFIKIATKDTYKLSNNDNGLLSEKHPSFPYNVMGFWGAISYQLSETVISYIRSHGKPDVIESEDYSGLAYFLLQKKLLGCPELECVPIVLTLHSSQYMLYPVNKMPSYQLSNYWVGRMEKFCTLAADGIIAPTKYIANQAINTLGSHLNIEIIPLPAPKQLLTENNLPQSNPTAGDIVYFGRLEVRKGILQLVKACSQLWDQGIDFKLTAIGNDTWYYSQGSHVKTYLKEKYHKYISSGQLLLHAPIQPPELYERIAEAWCIVIPSLWENFPNTCLESMLLGKVVLASSGVGHVEMLQTEDTQAGFIFDWQISTDFSSKLKEILGLSRVENLLIGKKARTLISDITNHQSILAKRIAYLEQIILCKDSKKTLFPSVNYLPHGKVSYPEYLPPQGEKGMISVCIPFYNHGQYIREALDSVYASNYPHLEILVINDGSSDHSSLSTLAEIQKEYLNLKVIHTENKGVAAARNKLAELAKGEFIAFLDSDDRISPHFYTEAAKVLNQYENIGFVASWMKEFGDSQKVWVAWNSEFPYLLCHNTIGVGAVLRKAVYLTAGGMKSVIEENLEDYECWISICERGWLGVVIPNLHYFYRIYANSRLNNSNRDQLLYLYDIIASLHPDLYREYAPEVYNLLNQNGSSWLWGNPSLNVSEASVDTTGMEILALVVNKLRRVYRDGGISLISNRLIKIAKSLLLSKVSR